MVSAFLCAWGIIPIWIGFRFYFTPQKVKRAQVRFRRRIERLERRLYRAHRATGLVFMMIGTLVLVAYFQPVTVYYFFYYSHQLLTALFPQWMQPTQVVQQVSQTLWF